MSKIIAVTGGIGSGKSVVCRILDAMGCSVYDCDTHAKRLMDESPEILQALVQEIHPEAVKDGCIDRQLLSHIVFADSEKLQALNRIVHGAVREDIAKWVVANSYSENLFIETAILYQSGLDRMVDEVWEVSAPERLRIERVMRRNGLSPEEVRARINSQEFVPEREHPCVNCIMNDEIHSLLLQIDQLLKNH